MPRIKIVKIPEGPGVPEEIRREWVGLELEAEGSFSMPVQSVPDPTESHGIHRVYLVPASVALEALKKKSQKAWEWFNTRRTAPKFGFNAESCEVIRD